MSLTHLTTSPSTVNLGRAKTERRSILGTHPPPDTSLGLFPRNLCHVRALSNAQRIVILLTCSFGGEKMPVQNATKGGYIEDIGCGRDRKKSGQVCALHGR